MVDGLLTQYERSGSGSVVLLLHGWGDRAAGLRSLQQMLADRFSVVVPDLPGFGGTMAPPVVWGLTDYATFVAHFLDKLGIDAVFAIIGHSNGGAIAVRGLGSGILTTRRLVLLSSAGVRSPYNARRKTQRLIVKTGKALTMPLPAGIKKKLRRKVYDTLGSDMLVAEHLQETFKNVVTDDIQSDAARVSVPALLLYGENDRATPVRYGEMLHERMDGSTLEVLPGAGHFLFRDRPEDVRRAVMEFLA